MSGSLADQIARTGAYNGTSVIGPTYPGSTYAYPSRYQANQQYGLAKYNGWQGGKETSWKVPKYDYLLSNFNKTYVTGSTADQNQPDWIRPKYTKQNAPDKAAIGTYIGFDFPVGGAFIPSLGAEWISANIWRIADNRKSLSTRRMGWNDEVPKDVWQNYPFVHGLTIQQWYNIGTYNLSEAQINSNVKNHKNHAKVAYNTLSFKGPHYGPNNGGWAANTWTANPYKDIDYKTTHVPAYISGLEITPTTKLPEASSGYQSIPTKLTSSHAPFDVEANKNLISGSFTPSTASNGSSITADNTNARNYYRITVPTNGDPMSTIFKQNVEWSNKSSSTKTASWSNTKSVSVKAAVGFGIKGFSTSFSSALGSTTTVNNTSTVSGSHSTAGGQSVELTVTVQKGQDLAIKVTYSQGTIDIPYQFPSTIQLKQEADSTEPYGHFGIGNKYGGGIGGWELGGIGNTGNSALAQSSATRVFPIEITPESVMNAAKKYQVPGWQYFSIQSRGGVPNYHMNSTGTLTLQDGSSAHVQQYLIQDGNLVTDQNLQPSNLLKSQSDSQKGDLSTKTAMGSTGYTPHSGGTIEVNGENKNIGLMHINGAANRTYIGSNYADGFHLEQPGQTAHLFSGDDFVKGSIYADTIISDNNGIGGNKIETGAGDDYIEARNGGEYINAGAGDDQIHITLDSALVDNVYLGSGADKLTIDLSKNPTGYGLTVQDLEYEDELIFTGGSVDAEIFGSSVLIYSNGNHLATFLDYAKTWDDHNILNLQEVGLLNMNILRENNYDYVADWRGDLIKASAQGQSINNDHGSLVNSKSALKSNLEDMQSYFFDEKDHKLTKWGLANAGNYDNTTDFAHDFLLKASGTFKEDYQLPIGYF